MARLYLQRTLTGFMPADAESEQLMRAFKLGETYRASVTKPRSIQYHRLAMGLLNLTYSNQDRYTDFDIFRKAVAIAAGHVDELITIDGEVLMQAKSIAFDALDQVEFQAVFQKMLEVCCKLMNNIGADEVEAELSKYVARHYGGGT